MQIGMKISPLKNHPPSQPRSTKLTSPLSESTPLALIPIPTTNGRCKHSSKAFLFASACKPWQVSFANNEHLEDATSITTERLNTSTIFFKHLGQKCNFASTTKLRGTFHDPFIRMFVINNKNTFRICIQGPAITVTIELDWDVASVGKPIPPPYTTNVPEGTVLVEVMNKAADEDCNSPFNKYTSTYYGGLGHYITSIYGIQEVCVSVSNVWILYCNSFIF